MQQLSNHTISKRNTRPIRVMQFGGGNFLRAFIDWMIEELNDKTSFNGDVAIVKPTEKGDYELLRRQDGMFHVVLNGIKGGRVLNEKRLITCIQQIIHPYREWREYLRSAENPDLRFVISNTTEAGIKYDSNDLFDANPPHEFPAKLTVWLYHRFIYFSGDSSKTCIFLPLELVEQNGDRLKECMIRYAQLWQLGEDFRNWVNSQIFCNTLVDRIVSGFPKETADDIQNELGVTDDLLVAGEYYHSWIIQAPLHVQKELPFSETDLNVKFVNDLNIYREIKVRILNGAHTSMVPVAYLYGIDYVRESIEDEVIGKFIKSVLFEEICPTLDFPSEELISFANDVIDRFRNPHLSHALMSISLNSISKFKTRVLPSLLEHTNRMGALPAKMTFSFASLLAFYSGRVGDRNIALKDDKEIVAFFKDSWEEAEPNHNDLTRLVRTFLSEEAFWGQDLTLIQGLADLIANHLENILRKGMQEAIKSVL